MIARRALALGVLGTALAALAACSRDPDALQPASVVLHSCRAKGVETEVRCADIPVPERRSGPGAPGVAPRTIPIHFTLVPALARVRRPDPVFVLAGGPGQSASSVIGAVMPLFARLNRERDIVFVDQRGTGASHPLGCEEPEANAPLTQQLDLQQTVSRLRRCAQKLLAEGTDPSQYLTVDAVKDLDEVRARLGYVRINLWGGSYGTRVALEYLRQFPGRVRSAVLDGVAPADMRLPLSFAVDTDSALDQLISACQAERTCDHVHPELRRDVDGLFRDLHEHARSVRFTHPFTGRTETVDINFTTFASLVRAPLYNALSASLVPLAIAKAAQGDFGVLAAFNLGPSGDEAGAISMGMHLSVVCGEDMSIIGPADLASVTSTRFQQSFYDEYRQLCAVWPTRAAPAEFFTLAKSDAPILMLAGGLDPATPPRHAERLATHLPNAHLLIAPNLGHGISLQGCAPDLIEAFVRHPEGPAPDGACLRSIPRPTFFEALSQADQ